MFSALSYLLILTDHTHAQCPLQSSMNYPPRPKPGTTAFGQPAPRVPITVALRRLLTWTPISLSTMAQLDLEVARYPIHSALPPAAYPYALPQSCLLPAIQ